MWILHFLYHLKSTGTAGFVMATGELSNGETARREVRQTLVDADYVDCIVQLSGQLFANTQIPCALWFLAKNRGGTGGFRKRKGEILFLDGRKLGLLIPGSRKQKELASEEVERMAAVYRTFKRTGIPETVPGFCRVATVEEVRTHGYALTPGRYVGSPESDEDEESFEEKMPRLVAELERQFAEGKRLETTIRRVLADNGYAAK
jgi:type I restriction enzyme M protein